MSRKLMIQGTMSGAGKSLLTAGILRALVRQGAHAAPFKSQNMALNSYVTADGLEMGRAQVMQAEAAGIEPEADMNPILLKPNSDTGSQVIVNGRVYGDMSASAYFAHKKKLVPVILEAWGRLEQDYWLVENGKAYYFKKSSNPAESWMAEGSGGARCRYRQGRGLCPDLRNCHAAPRGGAPADQRHHHQ